MSIKIVCDSSANVYEMENIACISVPLKIICGNREFVDDENLDTTDMTEFLKKTRERSSTSCPNVQDWLGAFEGANEIYAVTITSNLSGSCAACMQAAREYEESHPGAKVCVLDSLSTGPEMHLIMEKLREHIAEKLSFEQIKEKIKDYMQRTHLLFSLQSLTNLARNGRVNPAVAKVCGVLGIRVVGKVTDGRLDPQAKCRGEKRSIQEMIKLMGEMGYNGGKVRICHVVNPEGAESMAKQVLEKWPGVDLVIRPARGLVSYYAELNGLLMAFETK